MTVLRIGLESLLGREGFKPEVYEELSTLLHQTRRLTGVIDDLLLLSRMDAGHLQIASTPVNLSQLVDEWLDDLGALPESPDVKIEKEFPRGLLWLERNATRRSSCKIFWRTRESTIVRAGEFGLARVATAAT
jgi:signal transduction histidine kinase